MRRISPYLTRLLIRAGLTANAVTALMIVTGAASGFALLVPGLGGAVLAVLLTQLQMLWDASDGEVARWRGTSSPLGVFLDKVGHYLAESLIPLALGVRAAGGLDERLHGLRMDDARRGPRRGDRGQQGAQRHGARGARPRRPGRRLPTTRRRRRLTRAGWPASAGSPGSCRSTGCTTQSSSACSCSSRPSWTPLPAIWSAPRSCSWSLSPPLCWQQWGTSSRSCPRPVFGREMYDDPRPTEER